MADRAANPGLWARLAGHTPPGHEKYKAYRAASIAGVVTVIVTGGLALFSGTILSHQFFSLSWEKAIGIGLAWSSLIVAVDILILSQYPSPASTRWKNVARKIVAGIVYTSRAALALGVGFLVAEPVSLYLWDDVVQRQSVVDIDGKATAQEIKLLGEAVEDGEQLLGQAAAARQSVIDAEQERRTRAKEASTEFNVGSETCGTQVNTRGDGPCFQRLRQQAEDLATERDVLKAICAINITGVIPDPKSAIGKAVQARNIVPPEMPIGKAISNLPSAVSSGLADFRKTLENVTYAGRIVAFENIRAIAAGQPLESPVTLPAGYNGDSSALRGDLQGRLGSIQAATPTCNVEQLVVNYQTPAKDMQLPSAVAEIIGSLQEQSDQQHASVINTPGPEDVQVAVKPVSQTEARSLMRHYWTVMAVLIILDLLPLSYKLMSGSQRSVADYEFDRNLAGDQGREKGRRDAARNRRIQILNEDEPIDQLWHKNRLARLARRRELRRAYRPFGKAPEGAPTPQPLRPTASSPVRRPAPAPDPSPSPSPRNYDFDGVNSHAFAGNAAIGRTLLGWTITAILKELNPDRQTRSRWQGVWRVRSSDEPKDSMGGFVMKLFRTRDEDEGEPHEYTACKALVAPVAGAWPGIAPILACRDQPPFYFIITPFYEDGTLGSYFADHPEQRTLQNTLLAMKSVLAGVGYAAYRIKTSAHNDIKPDNIAVSVSDAGGQSVLDVHLLDWGFSAEETGGTPFYAAPERWRGEARDQVAHPVEKLGQLGEIYGIAAVMYWAITGSPPRYDLDVWRSSDQVIAFQGTSARATPIKNRLHSPDLIPDSLADLIDRWLDPDPLRRLKRSAESIDYRDLEEGALQLAEAEFVKVADEALKLVTAATVPLGSRVAKETA